MIDWSSITREDSDIIDEIVERACDSKLNRHKDVQGLTMDIAATHISNPLRLQELLDADDFNFGHDICGIQRHLDRDTGTLINFFSPRFSAPERVGI